MNIWTWYRFNKNYISRGLSTIVTTVTMNVIRVLQLKILSNIPGIFVLPLTWCQRQLFCLSLLWAFLCERALNPYVDVHGGPFYEQFFFRSQAMPDILGFSYQSFWERCMFDSSLFFFFTAILTQVFHFETEFLPLARLFMQNNALSI